MDIFNIRHSNNKFLLAILFLFLTCALPAASIDYEPSIKKSAVDFTSGNYVAPEASAQTDETQATPQAESESDPATTDPNDINPDDINPNGPWMICQIAVDGLNNISKKTVLKNISAKEGHLYYRSSNSEDFNALSALGNFDNVSIDISRMQGQKRDKEDKADKNLYDCHKMTISVEERPTFDKIIYKGRKALSKNTIQNAMSLKLKDPYSSSKLASDMEKITAAYAEKGYINTQASFETEINTQKNIAIATITIVEGVKTRVKDVLVEGLNKVPLKKFIKKLSNRPGKVYKSQNMPADMYKVTTYVRNLGFYDFKIDDYFPTFSDDKTSVSLTYKVSEGHKAKFGATDFSGNTVYTNKELQEIVFYKDGQKFNQQKFDTTVRDLQEKYANKGYLRAEINPVRTLDEETGKLNIDFDITENNIVYIDHVDITGNETTKTYVFARELVIKEGDIFSYDKVRRSQAKIMNLGFVNDAQIDISPTNDISKVDVSYNVVEGRPGMFTAGIAMSSLDGLYGDVSINHLNLFGRAQKLTLRALFGSKILDYNLGWSTPWIGDRPISFGVDAFNTRRYRSYRTTSDAYTEKSTGGRISLGPRFNDDIYNLNFSYTFENIHIYDIDEIYQNTDDDLVEGRTNVSTLGVSFAIDTRDNYWDTTSGSRNSLGVDLSGGPLFGDLDIYQVNLKSSYSKTLINIGKDYPIVLMIANRAGMVKPYGRTSSVPAYERIFLGGADTVRGYDTTGQIGPETGGEVFYVGNVELKFPLAREGRRTIAQLAAFFDIGNSWKDFGDIKFKTGEAVDEFKMGVGMGLRIVTPTLPIRLDWGYGLNHKTGEKKSHIYFSIANLF
ncbi:MAG: outer membrane protein assembly factor BamA [Elusimicrobiota bacterium]|jgi:outer membrane protein insertion porin family|nr:outer membrane protein assembly factor BamA [Elusimicrobiota bacterium]